MRSIHLFLIGYFVMVVGIGVALWQVGLLGRVSPVWLAAAALIAGGIGIMMAVSSGKSTITESIEK
jgi:hypothetical protein